MPMASFDYRTFSFCCVKVCYLCITHAVVGYVICLGQWSRRHSHMNECLTELSGQKLGSIGYFSPGTNSC